MVRLVQTSHWVADDGKKFNTQEEAIAYEEKNSAKTLIEKFLKSSSGKDLINKHYLDEEGIWEVRGEDPNADNGGHHHNPYIGTYQGELSKVIEKAVTHPKFWAWGWGGIIRKIEVEKI